MSEWRTARLSEVADLCLGKMLDQKKNKGELRPYLGNLNVRWGSVELDDLKEMRFEDRELERYGLQEGDIVMCEGGEPGRCALWKGQAPTMMIQKALHRIRPFEGVDSQFLFYALFYKGRSGGFDAYFTGATIKHLPGEQLAKIEVSLPPIETQWRIAGILGAYDDLIEVNRRRVAVLEDMARGLFEEWFVRLRFPGHESVPLHNTPDGPLPEGWRWGELGEQIELAYGKALKATERQPGPYPVIGSSGIVGEHCEAYERGPGIVVGRKGNVGAIIWSPDDFWPIDTVFFVRSASPQMYLLQLLQRVPFQNTDAAVPGLNRSAALKKVVRIPPARLEQEYHRLVWPMRQMVDELTRSNQRLAASRDLLLPRLMSGGLSVAEAQKELEIA